jgi:ABC-2 type transport system ATP-binding protein
VRRSGQQVEVTGSGELLTAVTSTLARQKVVVIDLRLDQATLDDAFLVLTGRASEEFGGRQAGGAGRGGSKELLP